MRTRWLATIALLLLPAAGGAEQLDYGIKTQGGWSQNVYGIPDDAETVSLGQEVDVDPIADYSARISPWGQVSDKDGDLTWSLRYQPSYEYYLDEGELNGLDHDASGTVAWRAGERTTLIASGSFRKYRSITRFNENAPGEEVVMRGRTDDLTGSATSLAIRRRLSPLDDVWLTTTYSLQEYGTNVTSEVDTWVTSASYDHTWSERTRVGASGTWTRQRFTRDIGDDAITDYYNISATLGHSFSRTLRFELSVGPTLIDSDTDLVTFQPQYLVGSRLFAVPGGTVNLGGLQAIDATNCAGGAVSISDVRRFRACLPSTPRPALTDDQLATLGYSPQGQLTQFTAFDALLERDSSGSLVALDDSGFGNLELTYFARAALIKEWERWRAELSYERSADETGSFGATSVRDGIELALSWEPARFWGVGLNGGVMLLDQASEAVVPSEVVVANQDFVGVGPVASVQQVVVTLDDDALSYQSLYASLSASRQLTERAKAFATLYWFDQEQKSDPGGEDKGGTSTTSNLTLWVGVEWQFDTLKF